MRVFDPIAGGDALLVLDMGSEVNELAVFKDPAAGLRALACAAGKEGACLRPGRGWRRAARARCWFSCVCAGGLQGTSDGRAAAACGGSMDGKVRIFDAVSGGDALLVLDVGSPCGCTRSHLKTWRRARCDSRVGSNDQKVRVSDPVTGGEALVVLEGHKWLVGLFDSLHGPGDGRAAARERRRCDGVVVWNPAASGAAIETESEGHSKTWST